MNNNTAFKKACAQRFLPVSCGMSALNRKLGSAVVSCDWEIFGSAQAVSTIQISEEMRCNSYGFVFSLPSVFVAACYLMCAPSICPQYGF